MRTGSDESGDRLSRRRFLANTAALGVASFLGLPRTVAAEVPPEIQKIRLVKIPAMCMAPEYLAEELLRLEGFTEVDYVEMQRGGAQAMLFANQADIMTATPYDGLPQLDAGNPLVLLAGLHGGCYELFAHEHISALRDLKGKRVAVSVLESPEYYYIASMLAYVGMDPRKDIDWVFGETSDGAIRLFMDGKADAYLAFPPQPHELRAKQVGRVILDTGKDRPWEQYFCCMIAARPEFVRKYPVATKRAVRAILKATDLCATEPEQAARAIVAKGYEPRYEVALEVLTSLSYARWRTYNPEDTVRFYGLRLHEVGMIKHTPQKLIAQGTDWRFLNELKKELKG
jgi:NitT/TauT family transport system substrate-binding protein